MQVTVRASAEVSEVPPHVVEARTWIANWQRSQLEQAVGVKEEAKVVKEKKVKPTKAAATSPYAPSAIGSDGTLTFSSDALAKVTYTQAMDSTKKA